MLDASPYASSHISGRWRVDLLDRDTWTPGESLTSGTGSDTGIVGGRLEWSIHRQVRDSGELTLRMPAARARELRWDRCRVRVGWDMTAPQELAHPLGVYIPTVAEATYTGGWASVPVTLHGLVTPLLRQRLTSTYTAPIGAVTTNLIAQLLTESAVHRWVVTPSTHILSGARTWEPGTTILEVANDLCETCGYYSLHTSPEGVVQAIPYTPPRDRPVQHVFADDHQGLYLPGWRVAQDDWATPNRLVVMQRTSGDTPPLTVVVTDDDPASPYRYEERGEWVDADRLEVDAATMAELAAAGRRRLVEAQATVQTLTYQYGYLPLVEHDAVRFVSASAGWEADYTIASRSMSLDDPVPIVDATIRRTLR